MTEQSEVKHFRQDTAVVRETSLAVMRTEALNLQLWDGPSYQQHTEASWHDTKYNTSMWRPAELE